MRVRARSQRRKARALLEAGGAGAGAAAGAIVTGATGPLIGAPVGAAATRAFVSVGAEIWDRGLAPLQLERTGRAFADASRHLDVLLDTGHKLRADDFFELPFEQAARASAPWGARRPPAEELLEGMLLIAGRTYEERKLLHTSRAFPSLCVREDIPPALAHRLQGLGDRLSYRQLVALTVFARPGVPDALRDAHFRPDGHSGIAGEIDELARLGLLGGHEPTGDAYPIGAVTEMGPAYIGATRLGRLLHEILDLGAVPSQDVEAVVDDISSDARASREVPPR